MDGDEGISSLVISLTSEMEAIEIFSWLIKPKTPSRVFKREEHYILPGPILFFLNPLTSTWQLLLLSEWLTLSMSNPKIKTVKWELRKQRVL